MPPPGNNRVKLGSPAPVVINMVSTKPFEIHHSGVSFAIVVIAVVVVIVVFAVFLLNVK